MDTKRTWTLVCATDEIPEDMGFKLEIEGRDAVAAFRVGEEFFVVADRCTHGAASLAEGFIEGFEIECPFHGGKFDLRTGEPAAFPCVQPIEAFPTRVEDGQLYAMIDTNDEGQ